MHELFKLDKVERMVFQKKKLHTMTRQNVFHYHAAFNIQDLFEGFQF